MHIATSMSLAAPAKVNLTLAVGPPAPPRGYHPICSHFHCVDLCDDVTLTPMADWPAGRIELDVAWADDAMKPTAIDWPASKDLAVRAMAAAGERMGLQHGVLLKVRKRIPTGGGLGGGSADAGAVLRLCQLAMERAGEAHPLAAQPGWMSEVAMSLGSDVAFFADDVGIAGGVPARPAVVEGFGERIRRVERTHGWLVLIFPPVGCPTPAVYSAFDSSVRAEIDVERVYQSVLGMAGQGVSDVGLFNDLARPAMQIAPQVAAIAETASTVVRRRAHVSGSGSTLFIVAGGDAGAAVQMADRAFRAIGCPAMAVRLV